MEQGIGKSLFHTKNTSNLNTAGTRQDYFSHKYNPTPSITAKRHPDDATTPSQQHSQTDNNSPAPQQPYRIPRQMQNKRTKIIEAQHTTTTSPSYVDIPIRE